MAAFSLAVTDLHLRGPSEIIACSQVDGGRENEVGTDGQMFPETIAPVVETAQGGGEAQWGIEESFAEAKLQVEGDSLKLVVIGLDLSTQILGDGLDAQFTFFQIIVQP